MPDEVPTRVPGTQDEVLTRAEPRGVLDASKKYCQTCATVLDARVEICPACGIRQAVVPTNGHSLAQPMVVVNAAPVAAASSQAAEVEVGKKSDVLAFFLGLFLGPVGLWYKGRWGAGIVWLIALMIVAGVNNGALIPVVMLGIAIHAAAAKYA